MFCRFLLILLIQLFCTATVFCNGESGDGNDFIFHHISDDYKYTFFVTNLNGKEYDDKQQNSISAPFNVSSPVFPFRVYDKHDSFGDYREVTWFLYDYKMVVEYYFNGTTYQKDIIIDNTIRSFEENETVKVYFERKNPDNVYIKPILEMYMSVPIF